MTQVFRLARLEALGVSILEPADRLRLAAGALALVCEIYEKRQLLTLAHYRNVSLPIAAIRHVQSGYTSTHYWPSIAIVGYRWRGK